MKSIIIFLSLLLFGYTTVQAQVGIGTITPDDDAILEVSSPNRGFLMPRIALTATNDAAPMDVHIAGMTVYNTATSGSGQNIVTPGFYVNNGSGWIRADSDAMIRARWVNETSSVVLLNLSDGLTPRPVGTEFVALDNGNVGIGTKTPDDKLTVNIGSSARGIILTGPTTFSKSITFEDIGDNAQGEINWRKGSRNSYAIAASIRSLGELSSGRKGIGFFTGNGTHASPNVEASERIRITPDGRIAIRKIDGTSYSPNARLGIQTNQKEKGLLVEGIEINQTSGNHGFIMYPNDFTIQTTGSDKVLTFISGRGTNINAKASSGGGIYVKTGNVTRLEVVGTNVGTGYGGIAFYDELSQVTAKFTEDGKVGIGTDTPSEKLDINGAIKFENGGYVPLVDGSGPIPAGGMGTIIYSGNSFYGWTGTSWKKLDN